VGNTKKSVQALGQAVDHNGGDGLESEQLGGAFIGIALSALGIDSIGVNALAF
jgi:hypothetical protein